MKSVVTALATGLIAAALFVTACSDDTTAPEMVILETSTAASPTETTAPPTATRVRPTATTTPTVTPTVEGQTDLEWAQRTLDAHREFWASKGPRDYIYTLQISCLCIPRDQNVRIEIHDGKPVYGTNLYNGTSLAPSSLASYGALESLFDSIQEAIAERAYQVHVSYEMQFGFPTYIYVDDNARALDDDVIIWVTDFDILR